MSTLSADQLRQDADFVHVRNLQLPDGILAPDIWRKTKAQPCLVSLELRLFPGFGTAASLDKLDATTLHYGHLCKTIRSHCEQTLTISETLASVRKAVDVLAAQGDAKLKVEALITLTLPKASAYEGIVKITAYSEHSQRGSEVPEGRTTILFTNMHVMLLIGLNAIERTAAQSVKFSCELTLHDSSAVELLASKERDLIELVQDTTFETLEALAITTFDNLKALVQKEAWPVAAVRLILEKPSAVIWADAPAVEIYRCIQ